MEILKGNQDTLKQPNTPKKFNFVNLQVKWQKQTAT